ncbi:alpha/beta fold hydrolase [Streptomyces fuscichromogenes]|uniref:4,5-9,10-diseco-3-hydroxy-5,9, 17-trioxoandrosta-1(10),2-diene-4-oate hydrolase n=1 Tax=Streptomyces fuscichromogenes TaxID=1324013 RepID=A0A917XMV8_9ACTN|nr:alpha/beta hydrolase [Streptomyces fuscichromogenes]GGN40286.1 4,5-9,10-diseco-3-hydroxy-5,9,17-trioxoandrosta-1(10),2-diene-4-oate hydrolase [Streptomyces fuscichromogenes]
MNGNHDTELPACEYFQALGNEMALIERGQGMPTFFLHGGGPGCSSWTDFALTVPHLADSRRMLLVDLLQYGRSSKVVTDQPLFRWHADHLIALMDSKGIERADFVGGSLGGSVALALSLSYPDRVGRIVLSGSTPTMQGWTPPDAEEARSGELAFNNYFAGEGPTKDKLRHLLELMEWRDGSKIPDWLLDLRFQQSAGSAELREFGAMMLRTWNHEDLFADLRRIQAPTLLLFGRHDPFGAPSYAQFLADHLADGHVHIMGGASHHLAEEHPAAYASVVRSFLDAAEPGIASVAA